MGYADLQNDVMKAALQQTGLFDLMVSEEDDFAVPVARNSSGASSGYVAVFDPLDGSSNIDASIPTGTIWGLYRSDGSKGTTADGGLGFRVT